MYQRNFKKIKFLNYGFPANGWLKPFKLKLVKGDEYGKKF
jgi:hypothetical protein